MAPISATEGLTISKKKLVAFLKAVDLENPVPGPDEIGFNTFRNIFVEVGSPF